VTEDPVNGQDRILTVEQLADMLGVTPYTVRQWAREHKLPTLRLGKYWRFRESSIRQWLADQEKPTRR
jgi:excisionase family DNA binding protein